LATPTVLNGISFRVQRGETMVIMGGSGCGKAPAAASDWINETGCRLDPDFWRRHHGHGMNRKWIASDADSECSFNQAPLLQSLTVGENVALPIQEHSKVDDAIVDLVIKMKLELVGADGVRGFEAGGISGGMKKRVALARALALDPELLFSDEPLPVLIPS